MLKNPSVDSRYVSLFPVNIYRPQRSCGQGNVFTRGCDSVHREGLPQCMLGYHTPPPPEGGTPWEGGPRDHAPPQTMRPPAQSMLGDTINARPVCILLECDLVMH